jgi:oligopeptide/dipeptide ABC transporter ATP-binding protein
MRCAMRSTRTRSEAVSALLDIRGLCVDFPTPAGVVHAVRELTLSVAPGECLGVVGESGAGKSQAFMSVLGLQPPQARIAGSARFLGRELLGLAAAQLDQIRGAAIGTVFQDPFSCLTPHLRIGAQIGEVRVRHLRESARQARRAAQALLERVHIGDAARRLEQYPHELSGGLRQRAMIALALASNPQLVIADEPTSALDVTVQAQILALLLELKRSGLTLVLISHDLGAVAGVADRIGVLRDGALVECGSARQVLEAPQAPYTHALVGAAHALSVAAPGSPAAAPAGAVALAAEEVSVTYHRPRWGLRSEPVRALEEVSLALRAGESLAVVGESGSGKSTLARALLELLPVSAGRILWQGTSPASLGPAAVRARRAQLQLIFQDGLSSLDPRQRAFEVVAEGLSVHAPALGAAEREERVLRALVQVGLEPGLAQRYPHQLSGGQCQRLGIARAMVLEPAVLVCDEPLSALDVSSQAQLLELLQALKRRHRLALLFITHNLSSVRALCERVLVLLGGRMVELAPAATLFSAPAHPYTRELIESVPRLDAQLEPARLLRARAPSPEEAPAEGCPYRARCAYAEPACATKPVWDGPAPEHRLSCRRWRELPPPGAPL